MQNRNFIFDPGGVGQILKERKSLFQQLSARSRVAC